MRNNNWKIKAVVVAAFIISILVGCVVVACLPEQYDMFRGMCFFGSVAIVTLLIVFVAIKIFRIGEE